LGNVPCYFEFKIHPTFGGKKMDFLGEKMFAIKYVVMPIKFAALLVRPPVF
jgi:hypothetical protein